MEFAISERNNRAVLVGADNSYLTIISWRYGVMIADLQSWPRLFVWIERERGN
jgi:hypothetical protein